jgi:MSHA biogenesis protein MshG
MSRFVFKARGPHGIIEGVEDGDSPSAVADALSSRGLVPITIRSDKPHTPAAVAAGAAPVGKPDWLQPRVKPFDVMMLSRQLYTLLKAGVPILRALAGLQETTANLTMKGVLLDLRRSLESGLELSAAMLHHPKVFDAFYVAMVRVGEASGRLEEIFLRLFEHIEFEQLMRQQVKSALRYPSFVITAMVIAVAIINVMVIPAFATMFKKYGNELPLPTQVLIATSDFTLNHGWVLLVGVVVAFVVWRHWVRTEEGRLVWHRLLLKAPVVGEIVKKAALARFTRSFALSLRSGVPLERALSGVAHTVDNAYISQSIEELRDHMLRGETLAHAAAATGVFTPIVLQMIAIGEETGMLDELLEEVGELYTNDVQYALKTLSQQIEPILIIFMGGLVLMLALGVFLPMWNLGQMQLKN